MTPKQTKRIGELAVKLAESLDDDQELEVRAWMRSSRGEYTNVAVGSGVAFTVNRPGERQCSGTLVTVRVT